MKEPLPQKTMLKNVDWGGLTVINLLSVFVFPPYFVYLMTMAALTATGMFWTTHISEAETKRLIDFEKEFRPGYKLEKAGKLKEAIGFYEELKKRYAKDPQYTHIINFHLSKISSKVGKTSKNRSSKKVSSPKTKRPRS